MRAVIVVGLLAFGGAAVAQDDLRCSDDPALEARYRELIESIRCMQCQNQSIASSPSQTAKDIKRLACDRLEAGQSEAEIRDYLASRYTDFINYLPPFKPSTWLLWGAPGLLLLAGGVVFARTLRARMQQPLDEDADE